MMKKSVMAIGVAALLGMSAAHAVQYFEPHSIFNGGHVGDANKATNMGAVVPGGIGHVLFTPYYSTVNGNTTLISLVNTDQVYGKAVKVRFRGAANSDDVLDFTVLLSPGDVWTASIEPSLTKNARILSPDSSCVLPRQMPPDNAVDFRTFRLDPKLSDDARALHTREGYIEFLNMADISPWQSRASGTAAKAVAGTKYSIFSNAKHTDNKAPCDPEVAAWLVNDTALNDTTAKEYGLLPPTGGLFGNWAIFNNVSITSYGGGHYASAATGGSARLIFAPQSSTLVGDTVAAENTADPILNKDALWGAAQTFGGAAREKGKQVAEPVIKAQWLDLPDLSTPYTSADISSGAFTSRLRSFSLSKALEASSVSNEFVATPSTASVPFSTDWVFSQPTRRYQVALAYSAEGSGERNMPVNAQPASTYGTQYFFGSLNNVSPTGTGNENTIVGNMTLGTRSINGVSTGDFLCAKSKLGGSNREEASITTVGDFSPAPVAGAAYICGETATLSFNSDVSKVLHSALANQHVKVTVGTGGSSVVQAGWATLSFKQDDQTVAKATKTFGGSVTTNQVNGLPVIGYAATSFTNGRTNGNFGDAIEHRYTR